VIEKSPPAFFLQPHPMYPMIRNEFNQWVTVLRAHFPDHPKLRDVNVGWYAGGRRTGPSTIFGSDFLLTLKKRLKFW